MNEQTQILNKTISWKHRVFPSNWELATFSHIIKEARLGGNYKNSDDVTPTPVIKMGNIERGVISVEKLQYLSEGEVYNEEDVLKNGDLLFNTRNTLELVGKVAVWREEIPFAVYNSNLLRLKFDHHFVFSNFYMNYLFNSHYVLSQLKGFATGTTSVAAIYSRDLNKLKLPLPPLPEQQIIEQILSTWDDAIKLTKEAILEIKKRNKGLAQQLLTGKKRLNGFNGKWKHLMIGQIAKPLNLTNKKNEDIEVLSCTKYDGLVPSLEYFGRQVFGEDLSKYKIVPNGAFAYATNHIEEGSIGYQNLMDRGLVSPMYTVFETKSGIDDEFLFKLLKSEKLIYSYQSNMSGSINRRGGLRWGDFSKIKIDLPDYSEQIEIAKILNEAKIELKMLEEKLKALLIQKKGLMQQLLTGEKRVKI